jgi:hypothetical protein
MVLSPSWEAASCTATQELPNISWSTKAHYRVHKSPPLVPTLRQINPVHTTPTCLKSILILSLSHQLRICVLLLIRATCHHHLILLDLIILITLDKKWKLWAPHFAVSPTFCHFMSFQSKYSPQHPLLKHSSLCSCLSIIDQLSRPYRTTGRIIVLYILIFMFLDNRREDKRFWTEWSVPYGGLFYCWRLNAHFWIGSRF